MPKLSIALLVFAVLVFMALRLFQTARSNPKAWPFLVLLIAAATQALLVSLRWDYGFQIFRLLQILLACLLPPIAWISFRAFTTGRDKLLVTADVFFLIPAALSLVVHSILPDAIDVIVILTFLWFGVLCLRLALRGEGALIHATLNGVIGVKRALWLVTFSLFASPVVDLLVLLDTLRNGGAGIPLYVGIGNLIWLGSIGVSALWSEGTIPEDDEPEPLPKQSAEAVEEDHRIASVVENKLEQEGLARDPNLTLNRLARRCGIPARQVSRAVNRVHNRSVSQFVNDVRVKEACRLLRESDISITQSIYDSGFQTKSNFNREFLRVTGKTPREWRASQRNPASSKS